MKISLISPAGIMYRKGGGVFPRVLRYAPLTLTTLAALVPSELEAEIEIIDEGIQKIPRNLETDLIGITAITGTSKRAYAMADYFRNKGVPVVLGGPHPTLMPQEAVEHADSIVTGLAFEAWPKLLRDFKEGKMEKVYSQEPKPDLSGIPIARRDLLKPFGYVTRNSMQATFGCPYRCDFCAVVATQKKYIHRPIPEVIKELESMNGSFVSFVDPSPIEDLRYAKELYKAMIPLKKKWGGLATVNIANDPELLDLMEQSGCKGILIGFETINQDSLNSINKSFNQVHQYSEVINKVHDHGIAINGTFMFGMDSDKKDCFDRVTDFVYENNIELPRYAIYTPFPGTALFNRLKNEGRITTTNWSLYDGQHVVFQPAQMSVDELREGELRAWENTYKVGSIFKRTTGSMCSPLISMITNFGYRYYAKRLRDYTDERMEVDEEVWNSPFEVSSQPIGERQSELETITTKQLYTPTINGK